jgi:dephospho-CoA kinase
MPGPLIGLTGGIGSGKSTVAAMLRDLGAVVIDADKVGHDVYRPGTPGFRLVTEAFGADVVAADGTIDRKALGARVFVDPTALARLNAIVHPLIGDEIRRRIAAARVAHPETPVVVEAAIMLEAGWRFFDRVWVVTAPRDVAIGRVTASRAQSRDDVERRIDAQMSNEERRQHADLVIENDGTLDDLRARVLAAWRTSVRACVVRAPGPRERARIPVAAAPVAR